MGRPLQWHQPTLTTTTSSTSASTSVSISSWFNNDTRLATPFVSIGSASNYNAGAIHEYGTANEYTTVATALGAITVFTERAMRMRLDSGLPANWQECW